MLSACHQNYTIKTTTDSHNFLHLIYYTWFITLCCIPNTTGLSDSADIFPDIKIEINHSFSWSIHFLRLVKPIIMRNSFHLKNNIYSASLKLYRISWMNTLSRKTQHYRFPITLIFIFISCFFILSRTQLYNNIRS